MISDEELLHLNRRGFIPGPHEDEASFLERVKAMEAFYQSPPFVQDVLIKDEEWKEARDHTASFYDIAPNWVVGYYSNKSLFFWQGAAAWISDTDAPIVQIRKSFRKGLHLRFYQKNEVLAHELVHAARMSFHEPRFEEVLAFSTSSSPIRKWGGPFFIRSWESNLFLFFFVASSLGQLLFICIGQQWWISTMVLIPWMASAFCTLRLSVMHWVFQRALKKIKQFIKEPSQALAVALRLTDEEISFFAANPAEKCKAYAEEKKANSLRWRLLHLAYF